MTFPRALVLATALAALAACASIDERPAVCRVVRGPDGIGGSGIESGRATSDVLTRLVAGDRGMGGTGISGADNRGMGGTGILAQNGDRGMGGTGIGNTGIIGVVTGFGSICVNGYEIELADTTKVTVEKLPAMQGDIRLGSVVEVEAYRDDTAGKLTAAAVNVRMAVAGPVESVAPDGLTAVIAGQTVRSSALARRESFARLRPGEWVAVSGLRRGDDVVVATSLAELERPGRDVLVAGPVRIEADGRRRIGALTLADSHIAAGQSAVARGAIAATASGTALTPAGVTLAEMPPEFTTRVANLSVEGFATALDSTQIRVGTITAGVTQTLAGAFKADLGGQVVVQLEGRMGTVGGTVGGVFTTDRVLLPDRPLDGSQFTITNGGTVYTIAPGHVDPSPVRPDLVPGSVGGAPQSPPARPDMPGAALKP